MKKVPLKDRVKGRAEAAAQLDIDRQLNAAKTEADKWKAKYQSAIHELSEAEKRNEFIDSLEHDVRHIDMQRLKPTGESTAVLVLSDWHIEESVDPRTINNLNKYDLAIAEKRVKRMFERALMMIDVARGLTEIRSLVVGALGDFITGYIHEELEENNNLSPSEACLLAADLLINGLLFLKKEGGFESILVATAVGNHGRTTHRKRISSSYANSYEWAMYNWCERIMASDPRAAGVSWKIDKGYHNWVEIQGHPVRFHHGDSLKYQGGVGGITIPVSKAIAQWNKVKPAAYDYFGHFHQSINMNRWTCNGSVIGYGPYALEIKAEFEDPSQTLSVISRKRGKIFTDRVFCD